MNRIIRYSLFFAVAWHVAVFILLWWWQATRAENLISFRIPEWLEAPVCRAYGVPKKGTKITIHPDGSASGVFYSISIHKSQIKPWGTLWRGELFVRQDKAGEWKFVGGTNTPQW